MIPKKRFWSDVTVVPARNGFSVALDGRAVKTPAGVALNVPTRALADWVADEWSRIDAEIDPSVMPATRLANTAFDAISKKADDVVLTLSHYANTDLLSYWASGPAELVKAQEEHWAPCLSSASSKFGVEIKRTSGVMPVSQDPELQPRVATRLKGMSAFELAGFHDIVTLSGSMFLGLSWYDGEMDEDAVWAASRLDADWQISQWGEDEEEAIRTAQKRAEFMTAAKFCKLAV
ncbi:MAG: ATP12 family protein [Pseudomonadota bacterium]